MAAYFSGTVGDISKTHSFFFFFAICLLFWKMRMIFKREKKIFRKKFSKTSKSYAKCGKNKKINETAKYAGIIAFRNQLSTFGLSLNFFLQKRIEQLNQPIYWNKH